MLIPTKYGCADATADKRVCVPARGFRARPADMGKGGGRGVPLILKESQQERDIRSQNGGAQAENRAEHELHHDDLIVRCLAAPEKVPCRRSTGREKGNVGGAAAASPSS